MADKWLDRARQSGEWKVTISYDPRSADTIYLHYPKAVGGFVVCSLSERSRAYKSGSFWESGQSFEDLKIASANNRVKRADAKSTRSKRIQDIVKKATDQTEAAAASAGDISDGKILKSIVKNRAEERRNNRLSESFKLGEKNILDTGKVLDFPKSNKADYSSPNISELISGFEDDSDE